MSAGRVLIVDTDPGVRWVLQKGLARSGYDVTAAGSVIEALTILAESPASVVVLEVLPEAGLTVDAVSSLAASPNPPASICVSVDASPRTVMECMRRGAIDFLPKPFSLAEMRAAVGRAVDRVRASGSQALGEDSSALIGVSPAIQDLRQLIRQAAKTDLNCLIRGPSGVGKDVVAREIHRLSHRRDMPFIKVNCTALPENLLESELFGYEKGAFTGADSSKPGRFSLAHKGIIFLDEIGDMHPYVQAKILQVIEHKEFTKLGGGAPVKVDVQIIAATNANLEDKIEGGQFRDDLFFRLNEVVVWVPALADRREDIPHLVRHFIGKHNHQGQKQLDISRAHLEQMLNFPWPGNVRELESTIKRWLALGTSAGLGSQPAAVNRASANTETQENGNAAAANHAPPPTPEHVLRVLEECQWNRRKAAESLGMSYSALRRAIEKNQLDQRRGH